MARNVVVPVTVLAVGTALVWYGISNPQGGLFAGLGNLLRGKPNTKAATSSAGFIATAADLSGVVGAGGTGAAGGPAVQVSGRRATVVQAARSWLGVPYYFGGITRAGVDCSGLTMAAYQAAGIHLPRTSQLQSLVGRRVSAAQAQPGDLVCFGMPAGHVGIYLGGGQMIDANSASVGAVTVEGVDYGVHPIVYRDIIDAGVSGFRKAPKAKPRPRHLVVA